MNVEIFKNIFLTLKHLDLIFTFRITSVLQQLTVLLFFSVVLKKLHKSKLTVLSRVEVLVSNIT